MLSLPPSVRLFIATQVVDGRKGPDSLLALVHDDSQASIVAVSPCFREE